MIVTVVLIVTLHAPPAPPPEAPVLEPEDTAAVE